MLVVQPVAIAKAVVVGNYQFRVNLQYQFAGLTFLIEKSLKDYNGAIVVMLPQSNSDALRRVNLLSFDSTKASTPSLETARQYIYSIDFSMLIHKICTPDPNIARIWDEESALKVINYYRNYLWLLRKYSEEYPVLPPSIDIDEIWYHHILDTYKYHEDCLAIFGQYLHHYPYFGMRGEEDFEELQRTFAITQKLHFIEFGEQIESFEIEETEVCVNTY